MATDSKRELIVAQLVTNVAAIAAGATYFYTVKTADRKIRVIEDIRSVEMPLVMVSDEVENKELDSNIHTRSTIPVALAFVIETAAGGATASRDGNRMIVDLERLLISMHETTVSDAVVSVVLTGNTKVLTEIQVDEPPALPIVVGEVRAEMSFRTLETDPGAV